MALLRKSSPANATGPRDPRTYRDPKPHKAGALPPKIPGELVPKHVAIVMDGNGRWAKQRGLSRTEGHEVGEKSLFDVVEGAVQIGVTHISAYAFSTENWKRSPEEVRWLMAFNRLTIRRRIDEMDELGVRIRWSGRRPRLWKSVIDELEIADAAAALARDAIAGKVNPNRIDEKLFAKYLDEPDMPDVDLFLRSSGEQRTSNFMLWRAAYSEMVFLDTLWPDFDRTHLWEAIQIYADRDRRFGAARPNPVADDATRTPSAL